MPSFLRPSITINQVLPRGPRMSNSKPQNKKAVSFGMPTAFKFKNKSINPWANLSPQNNNRNKSHARIDFFPFL
jgi:hypothetical protein